ncbi:MAG: hypothetical protein ACRDRL_18170 [Sciscionella sp.]
MSYQPGPYQPQSPYQPQGPQGPYGQRYPPQQPAGPYGHQYSPPQPQGWQPAPGYPAPYQPPRRSPNLMAYVAASLFLACATLSIIAAIMGPNTNYRGTDAYGTHIGRIWEYPSMAIAMIGTAFTDGNAASPVTRGTPAGFTWGFAALTLVLAVLLYRRLSFARWTLCVVGFLLTAYYLYAMIWALSHGAGSHIFIAFLALVLWVAASVIVVLPPAGRAMRGYRPRFAGYPPPPPQYWR